MLYLLVYFEKDLNISNFIHGGVFTLDKYKKMQFKSLSDENISLKFHLFN
jgi:hypothetical protein